MRSFKEIQYHVDVVFCIDTSKSMIAHIEKIKESAKAFYQILIDNMELEDKEVERFRAKVITFGNHCCDDEPMKESPFFSLPEQNSVFENFVDAIEAKGEDGAGNVLDSLALAIKSDWTTGGDKRRHVIVLFTDNAAFPLGICTNSKFYPDGMPANFAKLFSWWEGTDDTFDGTYQPNAGRLIAFVPKDESWARFEAWDRSWLFYPSEWENPTRMIEEFFRI